MKIIIGSDVKDVRLRGRPRMGWMYGVKRVLNETRMECMWSKEGRLCVIEVNSDECMNKALMTIGDSFTSRCGICVGYVSWK